MIIAYITGQYARASDTFIRNEVIGLRRLGHQVHTFSIRRDPASKGLDAEVLQEQANTTYVLEQGVFSLLSALSWAAATRPRALLQAARLAWDTRAEGLKAAVMQFVYLIEAAYVARDLRRHQVQILHNHIAENSATVAMLAACIANVPFSMTVHGPGIFFHPHRWALGTKVAKSAFTAAITHFCRSQCMLFSDPQHWPRIHVVRCTTSLAFEARDPTPAKSAAGFLFVGRLCAEKGLLVLIDALIMARTSGHDVRLSVIGDGPLKQQCQQRLQQAGCAEAVQWLGWRSSQDIIQALDACRALVLPSFAEGLPVAIMESFMMGRPVITTQIAGIPELVSHGVNGWLVAPGCVSSLAQALGDAWQMPDTQLTNMGTSARRAVMKAHHHETELKKLEQLLTAHANQG